MLNTVIVQNTEIVNKLKAIINDFNKNIFPSYLEGVCFSQINSNNIENCLKTLIVNKISSIIPEAKPNEFTLSNDTVLSVTRLLNTLKTTFNVEIYNKIVENLKIAESKLSIDYSLFYITLEGEKAELYTLLNKFSSYRDFGALSHYQKLIDLIKVETINEAIEY